jgi:hypothetical protein
MRKLLPLLLALTWLSNVGQSATADAPLPQADPPAVIELFTSEGCSSCPPADALLGELAKQPNVIPIAFHVDYWDGPAWRDRFAIPEAARRQDRYVQKLGLSTGFTPQAVIDGRASYVGSDRRLVAQTSVKRPSGVLVQLQSEGGNLVAKLPDAGKRMGPFDVNLITYLSSASTRIGGGENSGRKLDEYNIVRSIGRLGSWEGSAQALSIPVSTLPQDADHAVVVIQQPGQGAIVAAAVTQVRFLQH